jgi:hypothetical protein
MLKQTIAGPPRRKAVLALTHQPLFWLPSELRSRLNAASLERDASRTGSLLKNSEEPRTRATISALKMAVSDLSSTDQRTSMSSLVAVRDS